MRVASIPSRRTVLLGGLGSAVLAGLGACDDGGRLDLLASGAGGRVAWIGAGDALGLADGRRVRLAGVEAPKADAPHAQASREALARLADAQTVDLLFGGAREDAYGRTLAQVRLSARRAWLQGALLDAGAVRVRTWADNRALAREMLEREAAARRPRRGLWALDAYAVRLPEELSAEARGLQIVEGRVHRTGEAGERLYLDFSEAWRSEASVSIPRAALKDFRAARLDPLTLQGRLIRVRGPAYARVVTVDHPEQIERLQG